MTGASIYGFIDYKKSSHNKEFTNLYKEPVSVAETKKPVTDPKTNVEAKKNFSVEKKNVEVKKNNLVAITKKEKNEPDVVTKMVENPVNPAITEIVNSDNMTPKSSSIKKKKVLSYKLFSRAPLEERYIEKELKLNETKKNQQ